VVAGVSSWGVECSIQAPSVFTRVSYYRPWIESFVPMTPDLGGGATPPCGGACAQIELNTVGGPPQIGNIGFGFEVVGTPDEGLVGLWIGVGHPTAGYPWNGGTIFASLPPPSFWHRNQFAPVQGTTGCSGRAAFPFPLPPNPDWIGIPLTPQAFFVCLSGEAVPTNALSVTIR
jgi:hypothetical protein